MHGSLRKQDWKEKGIWGQVTYVNICRVQVSGDLNITILQNSKCCNGQHLLLNYIIIY